MSNKIRSAVILAAGKGERILSTSNFAAKPLIKIFDLSLLERSIRNLKDQLNVENIYVVTGFNHDQVENHVLDLKSKYPIVIETIYAKYWERGNGFSAVAALEKIKQDQFYLQMSDHLFSDNYYEKILNHKVEEDNSYLVISKNLSNFNDFKDATKVKIENGNIINIGKSITKHNGYDSGFFIFNKKNFENINFSNMKNLSLSEIVQRIIKNHKLKSIETSEKNWIDIDTNQDLLNTKNFLLDNLYKKKNDGPVSRYINRPLSKWVTAKILDYEITPNQISLSVFILSIISAYIISREGYFSLLFGAFVAQLSSILDGCDGEVARVKLLSSRFGEWFDRVLDRYGDVFILMGLTFHCYHIHNSLIVFFIGFLAVGSKIILSYTAYFYDAIISERNLFRLGRDIIIFLVLIGSILNLPYFTLTILTILMNLEIIKRLITYKN